MMYLSQLLQSVASKREQGQGLVEYALIIALVAIMIILALTALGGQIGITFNEIVTELGG